MSDTPDAILAKQRALAAARQRRKRERDKRIRDVTADVVMAAVTHGKLAPQAKKILTQVREPFAQLIKSKGLTTDVVLDSTLESIKATSPMLTAEGCIERPDWSARASGRRDAIALLDRAGELPASTATQSGPSITVNIVRFETPQHMVDVTPDNDCETLTIEKQS